ncbi:MAG: conjugal transfer protein TraF [Thermocrinis sp.]|jgi:hypothetical protein|nr:conjugal transfer protein TraF [Thermocrinis sp.]
MWVLSLLLLIGVAFSGQVCRPYKNFYEDRQRGWFWKEVCVEEKKEEKKEEKPKETAKQEEKPKYKFLPTRVQIPWDILDRISPEDIQKIEQTARYIALMYPTRENILEHMRLIRWIREKSVKYAKLSEYYMRQDPILSYDKPTAVPMKDTLLVYRERERKKVLDRFADKMGLVVVMRQDCFECPGMQQVLELAKKEWNWDYRIVYAENHPNLVQRLGTQNYPDIFLVVNEKGYPRFIRIGSGYMTLNQLEDSLFMTLYMEGYINDEKLVVY